MAIIAPDELFTGLEIVDAGDPVTANSLVIPLSNFPHLSPAEYDPVTGDGREVARQIDLKINEVFQAIPEVDRPTKMTSLVSTSTLNNGNRRINVNRTYEVLAPVTQLEMVPED